jgi:AbrB family looped-hinge helix DNA binding protein
MQVKVSERNQISLPSRVRKELNIQPGDHLLVDVQDGLIIMMPLPPPGVDYLAGLHKEIWEGIDVEEYIREERASWRDSADE